MPGLRYLAAGLLLPVSIGFAADSTLESCRSLEDPDERLQCYDTVLGRTPTETVDEGEPPGESGPEGEGEGEAGGEPVPEPSALARRWQLVAQTDRGPFVLTPYRPNYILPATYSFRLNETPYREADRSRELDRVELKYQISFKTKIWPGLLSRRGDLWFAYTQKSFWQAYNSETSSPFRETNYEPELIYSWRTRFRLLGLQGRVLTLGVNHQSNGRSEPLSRSWNRIVAGALFDNGDFAAQARVWWRIPESAGEDDNEDIEDYLGRGELQGFYRLGEQTLAVTVRNNLRLDDNRGSFQIDYAFPLAGPIKGYLQYFHGYGEGLIDYDHVNSRVGLGVMLTDWF